MADKFQLDYLALKEMAKDKRSQVILDSIGSKWGFMERSIRNYNENSVPFLVVSYNDRHRRDICKNWMIYTNN